MDRIEQSSHRYHFATYCATFACYGSIITGLGPLIPYLAAASGLQQTAYSCLFLSRAIGFVFGALIVRYLQRKFTFHSILIAGSWSTFALLAIFSFASGLQTQCGLILLASAATAILEIVLNVTILVSFKGAQSDFWIQIAHGAFGIGGLLGPFLVYRFETASYFVMGLALFLVSLAYICLASPDTKIPESATTLAFTEMEINQEANSASASLKRLIRIMFFIYVGQQIAYAGWIASYAVIEQVSSKQSATAYSSIFWTFMTAFRFVMAFSTQKPSQKLVRLIHGQIVTALIAILAIELFGWTWFASLFSAAALGICFSGMYGLLLSIPSEVGLEVSCEDSSHFLLYAELGQAIISMATGYLMGLLHVNFLFYSILLCGIGLLIAMNRLLAQRLNPSSTYIANKPKDNTFELREILIAAKAIE